MTTTALASTVLTFAAIVAAGAVLRALGILRAEDSRPINAIIIYVALPAYIFRAVHGARLGPGLWEVVAIAWLVFGAMLLLGWLLARALKLEGPRAGAFILATALGNTGYIGYPVVQAVLGADALPSAIFYDVFGTVVALVVVGFAVARHYGASDEPPINPLREIVRFPAFGALLIALALRAVAIPEPVSHGLELLASLVAPLIMLSVGLSLRWRALGRSAGPLALLAGLRLLVAPAVALGITAGMFAVAPWALATSASGSAAAGAADATARLIALQAGVPTMMLTLAAGERFGLDTEFIASAIFVTTVAAAITLPLVQVLAFR